MPAVCSVCDNKCSEDGSDVKCCTTCKRSFHVKCVQEEGVKTRSAGWVCKDCKKGGGSSAHGSGSSTPFTPISKEFLLKVFEDFKKEIFSEIESSRQDLAKEIQTYRKDMVELQESMNFLSNSVDTANSTLITIQSNIVTLSREANELRAENKGLRAEVDDMKDKLRTLEQYSRRTNIEISGIPETPGEDPMEIVKDVGKALHINLEESQVAAAHRIPSFKRDRIPALVVQFQKKITRDTWINKYKEKKTLNTKDINSAFPPQNVYVNEHLSPENKLFLAKLKVKRKDLGYEYAWCRDGKFFLRKSSGDKCKRINNQRDLDQLK